MNKKKVITTIKPFDNSFIGKKLVFGGFPMGEKIGTVIAVTMDRVIYVTEDGREDWSWRSHNGKNASFTVLDSGKHGREFIAALELEQAYNKLKEENQKLYHELEEMKKVKKLYEYMQRYNEY